MFGSRGALRLVEITLADMLPKYYELIFEVDVPSNGNVTESFPFAHASTH
jgi:hypothetical protein